MNLRDVMNSVFAYLALSETQTEAWQVQDAIERAITKSGRRTKRGTLAFPNTMLVYLSSEAYDVVRPVERQVIVEIEEHLPRELQRVWKLPGAATLRVALTVDPELKGLQMRVSAAERDVTPDEPSGGSRRSSMDDPDATPDPSRVIVSEMGPRPRQWPIPMDRRFVMGRRPKGPQGTVKADVEFDNPILSRLHVGLQACRLRDGSMGLEVFDFGSQNGTYIDGKQIPVKTSVYARHGQVIRLGGRSGLSLRVTSAESDPDATQKLTNEAES